MVDSEDAGSNDGVVEADKARCVVAVGMLDFDGRDGLVSGWLFCRDRVPVAPVEAALAAAPVLKGGRFGEESREAMGETAAEVEADVVPDAGGVCLVGSEPVRRSDVVDDSRAGEGCEDRVLLRDGVAPWAPPAIFGGLSMFTESMSEALERETEPSSPTESSQDEPLRWEVDVQVAWRGGP